MKAALRSGILCAALCLPAAAGQASGIALSVPEAVHGMVVRPWPGAAPPVRILVTLTGAVWPDEATLTAKDIFGRPVDWDARVKAAKDGREVRAEVLLSAKAGSYSITARTASGAAQTVEVGIIPPPHAGLRPDSFFASNTARMKSGDDLALLEAIGMKIQRCHFQPPARSEGPPTGRALPLDFSAQDKLFEESQSRGIWVLPIVGYSLDPHFGRTDLASRLGLWGPPRNPEEFVNTWREILRHYPGIRTWEFWNEPWIFGWTWAATPAEYRSLQAGWAEMALKENPDLRIIAGSSSPFVRDNIAAEPSCWKGLLQGTTHHPYSPAVARPSFREGDNRRCIDDGLDITRRMGLPFYYLTEGGTDYREPPEPARQAIEKRQAEILARRRELLTPELKDAPEERALDQESSELSARSAALPEPKNNLQNAAKLVQYYVNAALGGAFMGNAQWEIGYGPGWTKCNTAFAVMTHLLEDRPVVADIWPEQQLITGAIFASPRWVTGDVKKLPRAGDLAARWAVPIPASRQDDRTKVAVIWALAGSSKNTPDENGSLSIACPGDIRAFDLAGSEILRKDGHLVVPFGPNPIFLTTGDLTVTEFRDKVATAAICGITPVNAYAHSLAKPAGGKQDLGVRVQSQFNRPLAGKLTLRAGDATATVPFAVEPGKLIEVAVPWPGVPALADNRYPIRLTIETEAGLEKFEAGQILSEARFGFRTIQVDGLLDDWGDVIPVRIDSALLDGTGDPTGALLNPGATASSPRAEAVSAWVYTAYDAQNIYLAARVKEPSFECAAGDPAIKGRLSKKVELPYKRGVPGGLGHITECGDLLQFAFGFRDRVPFLGRQMDDPYAWKGAFYDTDYCYAAYAGRDGDRVVQLADPDSPRRNGYQTEATPGIKLLDTAQVKITRDESKQETVYEIALPRSGLPLFQPADGRMRFGFILYNGKNAGASDGLSWSEAAGVFDFWSGGGSFPPNWLQRLPCQTFFGIENPALSVSKP